jgi:hypothetical protein
MCSLSSDPFLFAEAGWWVDAPLDSFLFKSKLFDDRIGSTLSVWSSAIRKSVEIGQNLSTAWGYP